MRINLNRFMCRSEFSHLHQLARTQCALMHIRFASVEGPEGTNRPNMEARQLTLVTLSMASFCILSLNSRPCKQGGVASPASVDIIFLSPSARDLKSEILGGLYWNTNL